MREEKSVREGIVDGRKTWVGKRRVYGWRMERRRSSERMKMDGECRGEGVVKG